MKDSQLKLNKWRMKCSREDQWAADKEVELILLKANLSHFEANIPLSNLTKLLIKRQMVAKEDP